MLSFLFAALAGAAMSLQGVMNTRLSEKMGLMESNLFVQATAAVLSLAAMLLFGKGHFAAIAQAPWYSWLGGALGLGITVFVMLSLKGLSTTVAISAILIAQLITAALIDGFGWMGQEKLNLGWQQFVGVGLMLGGMLLFKLK